MRRLSLLCAGHLAIACALAGLVLPLVPTTPFVLLAAAAYTRASPRFARWLADHQRLGPVLADWREHRAIPARAKLTAALVIVVSAVVSAAAAPGAARWVGPAILAVVLGFVLSRPSPPRREEVVERRQPTAT